MVLSAHVADPPDPVTKYRDAVSPALEHLVLRCLEKKPADRWQSGEELLTQLEAIATPSGGMTPTTTRPVARMTTPVRARKRVLLGAVATALVAATAVVVLLTRPESGPALDPNRVVVAEFRNETGDSSLALVGRMAGEWITRGIQQTGTVQVTPWETALQSWIHVQSETNAGRVLDPIGAVAQETGAGIVVSGTYYLDGENIRIQAAVNDAVEQTLLGSIDPVAGPRGSPGEAVGRLQQLVMGFVAVRFDERLAPTVDFAGAPPPFEAYQAFHEGMERLDQVRVAESRPYFRRAIELDSGYAEAYLSLAISHWGRTELAEADSVLHLMMGVGDRLTPYYRSYAESMLAYLDGDFEQALAAIRRAAEMAPGSRAWFWYGRICVWANRPLEAVRVLSAIDPESPPIRAHRQYWTFTSGAYHMLNEHEQELEIGRRLGQSHPEWNGAALNLQADALAALGRVDELNSVLDDLANLSTPYWMRFTLLETTEILLADGRTSAAQDVLNRAVEWFEGRPTDEAATTFHREAYGWTLFMAVRHDEAQQVFDQLVEDTEYPWLVNYRGARGFVAAIRGDSALALEDKAWLAALDPPYVKGHPLYWEAVVTGALGRRREAVSLLQRAYRRGSHYLFDLEFTTELNPLRGFSAFEEWLRPKG
jgi:tetratricopeptide (TPR) repeat protein